MMKLLLSILSFAGTFQNFLDDSTVVGYTCLVVRDGKVLMEESAGFQDREKRIPMKKDTIFEVMSMTKPFTVSAVMMLMEDGKLRLDDPVSKHLPEFSDTWLQEPGSTVTERKLAKPERPITIRDLMTHMSGMPEYRPAIIRTYTGYGHSLREATWVDSRNPGTCFQYSNTGLATPGRLVEVLSGKKFELFSQGRILDPLGLEDTSFYPQDRSRDRIAMAYMK